MVAMEAIRGVVEDYIAALNAKEPEGIARLYAEDATLEDPVGGGEVRRGRDAIAEFYRPFRDLAMSVELLAVRVAGSEAAFHFRVTTGVGEQHAVVEPIDVMTFNEAGQITSMRAFWNDADLTIS